MIERIQTSQLHLNPTFSCERSENPEGTCPQWLPFNGPFLASRLGSQLTLLRLPSSTRRIQAKSWTFNLGVLIPQCGASNAEQTIVAFAGTENGNPRYVHYRILCSTKISISFASRSECSGAISSPYLLTKSRLSHRSTTHRYCMRWTPHGSI